jgi:hypothetical protein
LTARAWKVPAFSLLLAGGFSAALPAQAWGRADWFTYKEVTSDVTLSDRTTADPPVISIVDCDSYQDATLTFKVTVDLDKVKAKLTGVTDPSWRYGLAYTSPSGTCDPGSAAISNSDTCFVVASDQALTQTTGTVDFEVPADVAELVGTDCETGNSRTSNVYVVMGDAGSNGVQSDTIAVTVDLLRPTAPTLSSVSGGDNRLQVEWGDDKNDTGTTYRVYWDTADFSDTASAASSSGSTKITAKSYSIDEDITNGVAYYVAVVALQAESENESVLSDRLKGVPIASADFWEQYQAAGGTDDGNACFVATAAWGTPWAAELGTLRSFRDRVLLESAGGRVFVAGYYRWGPKLADGIRDKPAVRAVVRLVLTPVVWFADLALAVGLPGALFILTLGGLLAGLGARSARRAWRARRVAECA